MPEFIPGLELSERFYAEAVKPILDLHYPALTYDAALVGTGSEVQGYDDRTSTDHSWGPRLVLFLSEEEQPAFADRLIGTLRQELPTEFLGWSTNFRDLPEEPNTCMLDPVASGPINHEIVIRTVNSFVNARLGPDVYPDVDLLDWLVFSEQSLREVTGGRIFHNGLGELARAQQALSYYPDDIWLYLMASQWRRISELEPFVGRTGVRDDDLGSRLIAATLSRDLMQLGFLIERIYAPYPKWFGTAFKQLDCAALLLPVLEEATGAASWRDREASLCEAYEIVATMHNRLGITPTLSSDVRGFHLREFQVIDGERFAVAIRQQIRDERVRNLPEDVGSVDQFVDSVVVRSEATLRSRLRGVYDSR